MNTKERLADICRISGLNEITVRSVISAERESILNSLKAGESATLVGRCVITPTMDVVSRGGVITNGIKLSAKAVTALKEEVATISKFEQKKEVESEKIEGILLMQIPGI